MSQKKVDAYKEQKANRKEIIKKEKRMLMIEKVIGLVVCVAAVCWVGYSVYDKVTDLSGQEVVQVDTVIDTAALDDYTASLDAEEEEADTEEVTDVEIDDDAEADNTAEADDTAAEGTDAAADVTAESDTEAEDAAE